MSVKHLSVISCIAILVACSTTPPVPAVLAQPTGCPSSMDFGNAISLTPTKHKKRFDVTQIMDSSSPCVEGSDGNQYYALFEMPENIDKKVMTIGSELQGARLFAPNISTLDANGDTVRSFPQGDMMYRGVMYSVQIRPRSEEKHILIKSNSDLIGQSYDSITTGFTPASGQYNPSRGSDIANRRDFSYEGNVAVIVLDRSEKKK